MIENYDKKKKKARWILHCPICFSSRNDLYLGGKLSLQIYKCLDCGYIGVTFIEVEKTPLPQTIEGFNKPICADCGKAINDNEATYCYDCGKVLCKDCGITELCSNCEKKWKLKENLIDGE